MYLSITKVKPLLDYTLELTFENKEVKIFDVKPYLKIGLYKTLEDKNIFKRVKLSYDSIEWPNGIDIDPEILYEKSIMKNNNEKSKRHITTNNIHNLR